MFLAVSISTILVLVGFAKLINVGDLHLIFCWGFPPIVSGHAAILLEYFSRAALNPTQTVCDYTTNIQLLDCTQTHQPDNTNEQIFIFVYFIEGKYSISQYVSVKTTKRTDTEYCEFTSRSRCSGGQYIFVDSAIDSSIDQTALTENQHAHICFIPSNLPPYGSQYLQTYLASKVPEGSFLYIRSQLMYVSSEKLVMTDQVQTGTSGNYEIKSTIKQSARPKCIGCKFTIQNRWNIYMYSVCYVESTYIVT